MNLNDITAKPKFTSFCDLEVGDYFIQNSTVIWMKTNAFSITSFDEIHKGIRNAIQITNNDNYLRYGLFQNDSTVEKIEITSIDYRRIK